MVYVVTPKKGGAPSPIRGRCRPETGSPVESEARGFVLRGTSTYLSTVAGALAAYRVSPPGPARIHVHMGLRKERRRARKEWGDANDLGTGIPGLLGGS